MVDRGAELRAIRERLGLSQTALAERLGVRKNTIARWERGERPINEPALRLARMLIQPGSRSRPAGGRCR